MSAELIATMRARVVQCRRLAAIITEPTAREALFQMADEGEADIEKLEAEMGAVRTIYTELPPSHSGCGNETIPTS